MTTTVRAAGAGDAEAIAALLYTSPQPGRTLLGQDRSPDPFARRGPFDPAVTLVVDGEDGVEQRRRRPRSQVDATVTAGLRPATTGGEVVTAAYVFDLAVRPEARGRGLARRLLGDAATWAADHGARFAYANVGAGNHPSLATFARAGYRPAADLTARIYPVFRERPGRPAHARSADRWSPEDWERVAGLAGRADAGHDLAWPRDAAGLRGAWEGLAGWRPDDVWTTGRAVLGLWDHRAVGREVALRLPVEARLLARVAPLVARFGVPVPTPPGLGEPVTVGVLLGAAGHPGDLRAMLAAVLGRARERGLDLVVTLHDRRDRLPWLRAALHLRVPYRMVARPLVGPPVRTHGPGERAVRIAPTDL